MRISRLSEKKELDQVVAKHVTEIWECTLHAPDDEEFKKFSPVLAGIQDLLGKEELDIDLLQVIVGTGCQTSNGHALLNGLAPIVWLSLSNYPSLASAKIFFLHEILHGLHYHQSPDYFFKNQEEKNHVGRQLVTEGLVTYATQQLYSCSDEESLWADYLPTEERGTLMEHYVAKQVASVKHILTDWERSDRQYFYASDLSDVDSYRSGYYVGLKVFQELNTERKLGLKELLQMPRAELDGLVVNQLRDML
jgi:hypothetical protein